MRIAAAVVIAAIIYFATSGCRATAEHSLSPRQLRVVNQRTILPQIPPEIPVQFGEMAISPDGKHLLFAKLEKVGESADAEMAYHPYLMDIDTSAISVLPVKPLPSDHYLAMWMCDSITSDGKYIHLFQNGDASVYDILNETTHEISEPGYKYMFSDPEAENIFVAYAVIKDMEYDWQNWASARFRLVVYLLRDASKKEYSMGGIVMQAIDREHVIVRKATGEGFENVVFNLHSRREEARFFLRMSESEELFWTPPKITRDRRYICFNDSGYVDEDVKGESTTSGTVTRIWDRGRKEESKIGNCLPVATGPGASDIIAISPADTDWPTAIVLDASNGWRWPVPMTVRDKLVCANGKFMIFLRQLEEEKPSLVLVELGG